MDPFDKSKCSFPVPDFASVEEEREWMWSLTDEQGAEIFHLMMVARWGEEALNRPMDRSIIEVMSMEEFRQRSEREFEEEEAWRAAHGWPSQLPGQNAKK
jgi:hypothetical protein